MAERCYKIMYSPTPLTKQEDFCILPFVWSNELASKEHGSVSWQASPLSAPLVFHRSMILLHFSIFSLSVWTEALAAAIIPST